jgi:pimeloyl-ACP methyl ester carboxylesterase
MSAHIFATVALIVLFSSAAFSSSAAQTDFSDGYVRTDDGFRLYYQKTGSGPVLIVPGRLFLYKDFEQLADRYTLISYDMRNRGKSESISDGSKLTIHDDVRDLETVRRYFHVEKFVPVGYSYLGLMVVMYAMEHADRVERIIQLGPVPLKFGSEYPAKLVEKSSDGGADPKEVAKLQQMEKDGYRTNHPQEFCEQEWKVIRYQLVGSPANVEVLGSGNCGLQNEWPVNLARHFRYAFVSVQELDIPRASLIKVQAPVLTIHGTKDRNAPYGSGREWPMNLPNARLVTVSNGAHNSFAEYPSIVFPAIRAFLAGKWPNNAEKVKEL